MEKEKSHRAPIASDTPRCSLPKTRARGEVKSISPSETAPAEGRAAAREKPLAR
ncbi:MAG: hypothetical protein SGPRY_014638, partial [Prymnesium sp.]